MVTGSQYVEGSLIIEDYIDSNKTLTRLLQTGQKVRTLESNMAEFRLSQGGEEASLKRQLRTKLEGQPDYTTTRVDGTTERKQEEEEDSTHAFFEPDRAFMVNRGPSRIEEALRSMDRNQSIDTINHELESQESHEM